jgi:DNA mismatch repair protein MutS
MQETAYILKSATQNSLLILDEIGRGTSTFDGVSIAWSILEYISKELNCKTLFATHYHELIELADTLENCENLSVRVEDDGVSSPVFLHKIATGAVDKSYGIHVAEMAGMPSSILTRAIELLAEFESEKEIYNGRIESSTFEASTIIVQPSLVFEDRTHLGLQLKEELDKIDVNQLTPLEALQKLYELKKSID